MAQMFCVGNVQCSQLIAQTSGLFACMLRAMCCYIHVSLHISLVKSVWAPSCLCVGISGKLTKYGRHIVSHWAASFLIIQVNPSFQKDYKQLKVPKNYMHSTQVGFPKERYFISLHL